MFLLVVLNWPVMSALLNVSEVLKNGGRIRLVGDNVNWHVSVSDERIGHTAHMRHAFATIAVVQTFDFNHLDDSFPQRDYQQVQHSDFLPSSEELKVLKEEYIVLMARSAVKLCPYFYGYQTRVTKPIIEPLPSTLLKNRVLPFNIVMKNEQKYNETVDILDDYENILHICYDKAGIPTDQRIPIHIGGDQMTRERFSGSKCLRASHNDPRAMFTDLSPITFELFHLLMNFLQITFDDLFKTTSVCNFGSLKFIQTKLSRESANGNVKAEYDAHKELLCDITDTYSVLAIMQHFGMKSVSDKPSLPGPTCATEEESYLWFISEIRKVVEALLHVDYGLEKVEGKLVAEYISITTTHV